MRQLVSTRAARRLPALLAAAAVLAATATSGLLVGSPQPARAGLIATGMPDNETVKHDRTLTVAPPGVLANDVDLLGSSRAVLNSGVSHGTLALRSNGGFTYVPDPGFVGTDSFWYHPTGLVSTAAKVTITVTNAAPVARPDAYSWAGGTLTVAAPGVLANDTDADPDEMIAELDGGGISGSFDLDANGGFRYTPGGGFSGSGTVHYRVWDGVAWSAPTTITLTLQAPTPSPSPKPTPKPTPTPTPRPTPTPTPILPLPSLPLPSLPLPGLPLPVPLPPGPATPTPGPRGENPRSSSAPSQPGSGQDRSGPVALPGSSGSPGSPGSGSGRGPDDSGVGAGPNVPGIAAQGSRLAYEPGRLDLQTGPFGILAGFDVWAVPAATLGMSGVFVLLWVAFQLVGGLAWIPAVRRLRGREKHYVS